ncbi:alpha/beta hydrolase (plasmid) [Deinococcus metallilatus]|uniref:Alpha/beta hydrolase n=1 Tax=Deinococcus metallilatus TaxID=1211322 RepID=A0AAJ5F9D8_9DEIO|nr:alpha/beta hydrolase [Deinococcus metallilatus]MBB5297289.1 pimeloyl-ACP methyl ester carboxylesterase [Deinococcus metallilatus]QBY06965.1 alpha/beta hydrolase [Deinococcus metallilatus]TLK31912.1 alpha/beta hydrolase [Deinococcus metallilatus]GMA17147.1 alpha/beta hydrolase fold protein [Deinococcus metallilatus]
MERSAFSGQPSAAEGFGRINVGGRTLAYTEVSPPSPRANVLFLAWLGGSRLGWQSVVEAVGDEYRVFAPDHRDTGDSEAFTDPYLLADLADDAADFLRAVNAAPAFVVGLSMGGMVAQHLALRHPELVRGLVLVSTTPGGAASTPATERGRAALFLPADMEAQERARQALTLMTHQGFTEAHPEALDEAAAQAARHPMSAESFKRQFRAIRVHDVAADLARITVPTLVLHGEQDDLIPLPNAERLVAGVPDAELRVYPGTGHMPHLERPAEFLRDLRGFLEAHA